MIDELLKQILEEMKSMNQRMDRMEIRMGGVENQLESLETRIGSLETRMGSVENQLESLETRMGSVENQLESLETRMGSVETALHDTRAHMYFRFDTLDTKLSRVEGDVVDIKAILGRLEENEPQDIMGMLKQMNQKLEAHDGLAEKVSDQETDIKLIKKLLTNQ
ncbi:hypothetical protein [Ammoniphilus sp. CFH 90114]|uniref:hypothetical protein n=1 Tax=Ammoniphilus sp. CFH 90114 TaxID=2493665 RepID=UPI00100FA7BE|nr:hypothetical protein [Ammoniphilus sp. CFH 90114]RXT03944.1 hypothetical protein EIZ39_22580 [Ammoniphilus sp. CFH 90114]